MRLYALCQDIIALRLTTSRLLRERCRMQKICMRHQRDVAKLFIPAFAGVTLLTAVTALLNISYTVIVNKSYL